MTDCLVSSGGLGGSPGVVAIASGGGGSSSSNNHSINGVVCAVGDQGTQQTHLPPALEMFAAAAAAAAAVASNGSTITTTSGNVGTAASGSVATVVTPSSAVNSAMDLTTAITSTGNNNGGSSRSVRQISPPAPLSPPSSASDASSSGACSGLSDAGSGDGCYNNPATTVPTSTNSAVSIITGKAVVGSGRIREKRILQLINPDTLEPFGYGPSHEQLQDHDDSHEEMEKLISGQVSCIEDSSAIRVGHFGDGSSIIDVHDRNDGDQAIEDEHDVLSTMNASEDEKDLMALVVYRKLQQEQQERQRVKRLQVPRKVFSLKPAQTIESKLQQIAPHHGPRQPPRREANVKQQQTKCEYDNEHNCTSADSMTATTSATLGDLLDNLSNCPDVSGVDLDEKLLMRLMRNLTTQVKQSNDAGVAMNRPGNNNHTISSSSDRRRQGSPRPLHDHLGNSNRSEESDDMLGSLETGGQQISDGENDVSGSSSKKLIVLGPIGSSSVSSANYQGHTTANAVGLVDEHDNVEHDLISSHHGDADNEDEENNDDLLGGSLEGDDANGDGSGGSSSGGDGVCGVCREPYTQPPRVLSCLHVFCEACLAMLRSKKRSTPASNQFGQMGAKPPIGGAAGGGSFVVVCPKCQAETECAHGVQTLPLDYVLINRLDTDAIRKRTAVCTSCKSEDNAIARCQDCSNFLCSNCRKAHSSMLCFENHKVVSFEAFDQERAQIHRAVSCLRHPREVAVLYDPVCGTTMCNDCLVAGHQGHGCKKAFHFDSRERTNLTGLLSEARQKFNTFDEANDILTTSLSELQLTRDSVRSSIEETFITYKNLLEQAKAAALEDLEKVHSAQEMRVMDDIQQCQESRVHLEHALSFADKLVKYGDAGEFLALKSLVTSRVRKLMCSCPQSKDQGELRFVTDEAKFAQAIHSLFGRVVPTGVSQHQSDSNGLLQAVTPSTDNPIGGLDSSRTSVSSVGSGTTSSLLNTSFAPEISNTSATRLLPADIVDAVSASGPAIVPPGSHFTSLEHAAGGVLHPILPPGGPLSAGVPPTLPPLDPIVAPAEINELRTALAQFGLATLAGVEQADVLPNPDVLPLLVRDVAPGSRGLGVPTETVRVLPPTGPPNPVVAGPTDEENHLMNNLSALAKMGPMGPAPYAGSPVPMNGHGGPLRGGSGSVAPLAIAAGSLPGGLDTSGPPQGQRSPTSSVASVALSSSTPGPPPSVSSTGNSSTGGTNTGRGTRVTPMHIRIKFGQLGSGPTQFSSPHGFCLGPNEEIVVADTNNHRVQIFDKAGELKNEFGTQGKEEGQLWYPRKVAVMKSTGTYVICDRGNERSRMQLFTKNGEFLKKIAIRYIDIVAGLALTSDGRIIAVDSVSPTVFVIAETGDLLLWFDCSEHMREPSDIAVWGTEFYICDFKGHCVVVYNECGTFLRRIGGEGLTNFPNGIDISDHGDILVGDSHGNRFHIVVFNREGHAISEFECPYCKVSRCCGLKITSEGYVVTLAKNNHHVLILNTLYIT